MNSSSEGLADVLLSFSKVLSETTKNSMEGITNFVSIFAQKLRELNSLEISSERKLELEHNCDLLISNGWVFSSTMPLSFITEPIAISNAGRDDISFVNTDVDELDISNIDEVYISTHNTEALRKIYSKYEYYFNTEDVNELQCLLVNHNYKAACMFLIALIEKAIAELFPNYLSESMVKCKRVTKQIQEDIESLTSKASDTLLYLRGYSLFSYLNELYKNSNDFVENDNDFKILNRHFLIHGRTKRIFQYKDCLSLVIYIYELMNFYEKIN